MLLQVLCPKKITKNITDIFTSLPNRAWISLFFPNNPQLLTDRTHPAPHLQLGQYALKNYITLSKDTCNAQLCKCFQKDLQGAYVTSFALRVTFTTTCNFLSPNFKCIISKHTTTVTALVFYIKKKFKGRLWAHLRCRSASVLAKLPPIFYVTTLWVAVKAANTVRDVIYQPWLHPSLLFKVRAEDWALDSANIYLKINHSLLL